MIRILRQCPECQREENPTQVARSSQPLLSSRSVKLHCTSCIRDGADHLLAAKAHVFSTTKGDRLPGFDPGIRALFRGIQHFKIIITHSVRISFNFLILARMLLQEKTPVAENARPVLILGRGTTQLLIA